MDYQKIIQENEILKETANLVYTPEFIPYYPKIAKKYSLTKNEALLYGFIRFYLANAGENAKFFFTNEQLIEILEDKKKLTVTAISLMIKSLCEKKLIDVKYTIKANGGKIRYITLLNSDFKSTLSRTLSKVKENNNKINNNIIFSKENIAKSEASENLKSETLEKKEEISKPDNGQPKNNTTYGDPEVNLIIDTYKKKLGFTPTDRKVRFVAHVIRQNIKSFIKEIAPYRKYTFEEVVEKAFNWYVNRDQIKGETLDVVRRKFKMLFEKTLKKAKEVQI